MLRNISKFRICNNKTSHASGKHGIANNLNLISIYVQTILWSDGAIYMVLPENI